MKKADIILLLVFVVIGILMIGLSSYKNFSDKDELKVITSSNSSIDDTQEPGDISTEVVFPIDINIVTLEQLLEIDNLSPSLAQSIIEFRDINGRYDYIQQLMNLEGITPDTYDYLCIFLYVIDSDF